MHTAEIQLSGIRQAAILSSIRWVRMWDMCNELTLRVNGHYKALPGCFVYVCLLLMGN